MRYAEGYPRDLRVASQRAESMDDVMAILGGGPGPCHVAWIRAQPNPVATCLCRARGMWDANLLREESAYRVLARILREETGS